LALNYAAFGLKLLKIVGNHDHNGIMGVIPLEFL